MVKISEQNFKSIERNILNTLNQYGKGYIVGGAIRDILLNITPEDIDFATNLSYDFLKNLFKDYNPKETGKLFGVLRIKIENKEYEIAKFRKDIYEEKNNLKFIPENNKVIFIDDITPDLVRRDFTINAMAYNFKDGLIDLYNGQKDIDNRIINFVGIAEERIIEDPLRILRAFRFMSTLSFNLSENTVEAIQKQKKLIHQIAKERIVIEFNKLLLGSNIKNTLALMKNTGVLDLIIPEFKATYNFNQCNPYHSLDLFNHIINVVEKVPKDIILKYTALLHDIAKPLVQTFDNNGVAHYKTHDIVGSDMSIKILSNLKLPTKLINNVSILIKYHTQLYIYSDLTDKKFNKLLSILGYDNLLRLIQHSIADNESKNNEIVKAEYNLFDRLKITIEKKIALSVNDLDINGFDIMNLGYRGKEIGNIKEKLLDLILEEKIENKKDVLLNYLLKLKG